MALIVENLKVLLPSFELNVPQLTISNGEIVSLIGPSGSGKSTLLLAIAGFVKSSGRISNQDEILSVLPSEKRRIGMVFQRPALIPHLNVLENVELGLRAKGMEKSKRSEMARTALNRLHVGELEKRMPSGLSGGEAQRVMLARVLVLKLPVVLLDEPFGAMDPPLRRDFRKLVKSIVTETGASALLVSHDPQDLAISNRVLVLELGQVTYCGSIEDGKKEGENGKKEGENGKKECQWLRSFLEL